MIIPELPDYLESIGGGNYKGYIISIFTLTAGLSRPISGRLADTIGRIPVMIFGALVCFVVGFIYPFSSTVIGFLFIRFLHGFSTGFKPTGTAAYVADIVPDNRRGEAMGVLGIAGSVGMAAGPAIGGYIAVAFGNTIMFYTSSFTALLSIAVLKGMKETLANPQKFSFSLLNIRPKEIIEVKVLSPSLVMMLTAFPFGIVLTLIPDFSAFLGLENKGVWFAVLTTSSVLTRFFAGKASDKHGRIKVLLVSTFLLTLSLAFLAFATTVITFFIGAFLVGIAVGMNSPTIFAWTADHSNPKHKGRAMSTMFIALEIGIGVGALVSGWIYQNKTENLSAAFIAGSIVSVFAFIYMVFLYRKNYA
jgi:MFS family permease